MLAKVIPAILKHFDVRLFFIYHVRVCVDVLFFLFYVRVEPVIRPARLQIKVTSCEHRSSKEALQHYCTALKYEMKLLIFQTTAIRQYNFTFSASDVRECFFPAFSPTTKLLSFTRMLPSFLKHCVTAVLKFSAFMTDCTH